jgi:hypothetical protein
MLHYWSEPRLTDALSDPVVQAVMAADAVDPVELSALLREAACKLELGFADPDRPAREARTQRISAEAQEQAHKVCPTA